MADLGIDSKIAMSSAGPSRYQVPAHVPEPQCCLSSQARVSSPLQNSLTGVQGHRTGQGMALYCTQV